MLKPIEFVAWLKLTATANDLTINRNLLLTMLHVWLDARTEGFVADSTYYSLDAFKKACTQIIQNGE